MTELIKAGVWSEQLARPASELHKRLAEACGGADALTVERLEHYQKSLERFVELFGAERNVGIVRTPGRLNVLGMHADHRGAFVNPMALGQETILVFSPTDDDLVDVTNLDPAFGRRTFRIRDVRPDRTLQDTDAWLDWTQTLAAQRAADGTAADWVHKLAASAAYLAGMSPEQSFKGFSGVMTGNIMPCVGLSSSSAVVVATMLATTAINGVQPEVEKLVEQCGVAEWYVGTRGGFGDHAAILCGRAGQLVRVRTVPELAVAGYVPFPDDYALLVFHSGFGADKTAGAGNTFNERTATYELAEMLAADYLKSAHAATWEELREIRKLMSNSKPMHLGDVVERLKDAEIYELLQSIPQHADRKTLEGLLPDESDAVRRQFATHAEPSTGYPLRFVLLYGIAECARAARGGKLLEAGDVEGFGQLMNISHDGDRVSGFSDELARLKSELDTTLPIWQQPGDYACSTAEVDSMVDIAMEAGASGAQVSGAGLGGSMMALVHTDRKKTLVEMMVQRYYQPGGIELRYIEAVPSAGATAI